MDISKLNLLQSEHEFEEVVARQKSNPEVVKTLFAFLVEFQNRMRSMKTEAQFKLHKYGFTVSCLDTKTLFYIDFHVNHASVKYRTGRKVIRGLANGSWSNTGDNQGSETFHIEDSDTAEQALDYALQAYQIAIDENKES